EPADGLGTWCIGLRLDVHSAGRPTVGVEDGELWKTPPIAAKISRMSQWALGPQTPSCESRRAGSITPGFEARSGDDGASLSSPRRNNEMRGMYGAEAAHRPIEWDSIALRRAWRFIVVSAGELNEHLSGAADRGHEVGLCLGGGL